MKRTRLERYTPLRATQPIRRSSHTGHGRTEPRRRAGAARRRDTGPTREVRAAVLARDGWRCVRCGADITAAPYSLQHRRARGVGGTRRENTNSPANLIVLCGSATSAGGCHQHVESRRHEAKGCGWAIPLAASDPAEWRVWTYDRGWIFLDHDGGWSSA